MSDCIFCKIVAGEIPSAKVFEDETTLAFLDVGPIAKGHTLVIPKAHYETMLDIPKDELQALAARVQDVAKAVVGGLRAGGFSLIQLNNRCAGQEVPHLHFHIVPRDEDDEISFGWKQGQYEDGEMAEVSAKIAAALGT